MQEWSVSIFGLGYVGLSHAVAYALRGAKVIGFDIDESKIKTISRGISPIKESDIQESLRRLIGEGILEVTNDFRKAISLTSITFVSVNTPSLPDGSADLSQVRSAVSMIGDALKAKEDYHLVVIKSTVPPSTTECLVKPLLEETSGKKVGVDLGLCVMPEFLREGTALRDVLNPWRIVIGEVDRRSGDFLEQFVRFIYGDSSPPIIRTTPVNAELIKYASNAFLAMRVSFINSIAKLCESFEGADVDTVAYGIGLDPRIGTQYLKAGPGYGGSCLPKDVKALIKFCERRGYDPTLFKAIHGVNEAQMKHVVNLVEKALGGLKGKVVSVLGLAFKAGVDDVRESPSLKIIWLLLDKGAVVKVHDPLATENARRVLGSRVKYASSAYECIEGSSAAVVVTDWEEYKELKAQDFVRLMKKPIVVDTRRIYKDRLKELSNKLIYICLGLGKVPLV